MHSREKCTLEYDDSVWHKFLLYFQDVAQRQKFVRHYVKELTYDAIQSNQKQTALRTLWPQILTDMVHSAIDDMWDSNNYMKKCLEQLEKS